MRRGWDVEEPIFGVLLNLFWLDNSPICVCWREDVDDDCIVDVDAVTEAISDAICEWSNEIDDWLSKTRWERAKFSFLKDIF